MNKISIVIPVYNSAESIDSLSSQIHHQLNDISYEIIFINDNSDDDSWEKLKELSSSYKNTIALNLAKNLVKIAPLWRATPYYWRYGGNNG